MSQSATTEAMTTDARISVDSIVTVPNHPAYYGRVIATDGPYMLTVLFNDGSRHEYGRHEVRFDPDVPEQVMHTADCECSGCWE